VPRTARGLGARARDALLQRRGRPRGLAAGLRRRDAGGARDRRDAGGRGCVWSGCR
jgi:hypothetical protein